MLDSKFAKFLFLTMLLAPLSVAGTSQATDVTIIIDTPVVVPGSLTISAPPALDLGTAVSPSTVVVEMGSVVVTDTRNLGANWSAQVIASALTNGNGGNTIIPTAMSYSAGTVALSGTGSATLSGIDQTNLTGVVEIATATSTSGSFAATWTPALTVVIPAGAANGTYTGTITHSVS